MKHQRIICFLIIVLSTLTAANVRMPNVFGSNMVLQRSTDVPVWGWADPGEKVTVRIGSQKKDTVADENGAWKLHLSPLKAGGPYVMRVCSGPDTLTFVNVLVGEVWLCSGQSNMEWGTKTVINAEKEIRAAHYPSIRLFTVSKAISLSPADSCGGSWEMCSPSTVEEFSAVAYFFGLQLYHKLQVPIGLINSSWGGTPAEAWTSHSTLVNNPELKPIIDRYLRGIQEYPIVINEYEKKMVLFEKDTAHKAIFQKDKGNVGFTKGWASKQCIDSIWDTMNIPGAWEDNGLKIDGAVWFRKKIVLSPEWINKPLVLTLGTLDDFDTTYVNGTVVGATGSNVKDSWSVKRTYIIPVNLTNEETLSVAIRLFDHFGNGGFTGKPEELSLSVIGDTGKILSLKGHWYYKVETSLDPQKITGPYVQGLPQIPMEPNSSMSPSVLYNAMIVPLAPFAVKGIIWYQGETNAGRAYQYRTLLPSMIADWRGLWREANLPFGIVQLANFMHRDSTPVNSDWAELREAQLITAFTDTNIGLAVAIDIGDSLNIHPGNKQDVGKRLSRWALAKVYSKNIEYSGPVFDTLNVDSGRVVVKFTHATNGLVAKGEKLTGFSIAGADSVFVWADARIDGSSVVVWSDKVEAPIAIRYGWANNPDCNLYNLTNLPAIPFRTDDFPGVTFKER